MLAIDTDADGKPTPQKGRDYSLNPWPQLPGLRYSVVVSESATTPLLGDSKGHGALFYGTTPARRYTVKHAARPTAIAFAVIAVVLSLG